MSNSLSSADRDARIAAPVSEDRALVDAYGESVEQAMIASTRSGATYKKYAAARGRCRDELVSALCSRAREIEELRAELRASLSREEEAKKKVEALRRYDCTTGGCGDPECCGSYGTMESQSDGEWVRFDDVRALSHSRRTAE